MPEDMDSELVSIITPAYRVESIIDHTIASVIAQTYSNWEMLIADDCSPDNTIAVVAAAAAKDSRIRLLRCEKNGGPAAARNLALGAAKGRWIAFLDSDDLWLPTKLEETLKFANSRKSPLTFTAYRRISHDGDKVGEFKPVPDTVSYNQLLGNTAIATSTVMIDRMQTGDFTMKSVYYDDFACWLEILKNGCVAHGLNKDLMRYRVVKNSVSRNKLKSAKEVWKSYRKIESLNIINSIRYFFFYSWNAYFKYRNF